MRVKLGLLIVVGFGLLFFLAGAIGGAQDVAPPAQAPPPDNSPPEPPNPYVLEKGHSAGDASRLYATAVDLMRQKQWHHAIIALLELRKSRHLATWNYRSSLLIGVALTRLGRDQEAVTWLTKVAPVFETLRPDIFLWAADAYFRLDDYKNARNYYRRAILEIEKAGGPAGVALREWPAYHGAQIREIDCMLREGRPDDSIRQGIELIRDHRKRHGEEAEHPLLAEILWLRALAHREQGRPAREVEILATIKLVHPECTHYEDAVLRLDMLRMEGIAPELAFNDELVRHANRLRVLWQHRSALDLIEEAEALHPPGSPSYDPAIHERLMFVKARTLMAAGLNEEAVELFARLHENPGARAEDREDYLANLARALGRVNRIEEASQAYARLAQLYPRSGRATQSAFMAAWLLAHHPEHRERADRMLDAFYQNNRSSRLGRKALWFRAWFTYRGGDLDRAYELFAQLQRAGRSAYEPAARYWMGRIHQIRGEQGKARSFYLSLAADEKHDYYQLVAHYRLKQMLVPDPDAPLPQPLEPILIDTIEPQPTGLAALDRQIAAFSQTWEQIRLAERDVAALGLQDMRAELVNYLTLLHGWAAGGRTRWGKSLDEQAEAWKDIYPDLYRAVSLDRLGLEMEAAEALNRFVQTRRAQARQTPGNKGDEAADRGTLARLRSEAEKTVDPELRLILLRQFILFEDLAGAFNIYVRLMSSDERRTIPWDVRRRFFYPMVFHRDVWRVADDVGFPDEIMYAVMRTESYFDPRATSEVNAMGLMQVMPHTGMKISMRLGEERFERERLYQPQTAIRFGAWYLAQLTAKFDNQVPLAIAAYNGGPHNVITWLERNPGLEWDEFVESIEFEQTRDYVKKVLAVAATYRSLYGLSGVVWDFTEPLRYEHHDTIDF